MSTKIDSPVQEPNAAPYDAVPAPPKKTSFLGDTWDSCLLAIVPCEPMARSSSSVGVSYAAVFLSVFLVFGGGSTCFVAASGDDDALFKLVGLKAVLAVLALNAVGLLPALALIFFSWVLVAALPYVDDDPDTKYHASGESQALVVAYVVSQVLYAGIVVYLRHKILARSGAQSCCKISCCGFLFACCFPWCAFAEASQRARDVQNRARRPEADELPAYQV